VQSVFSKLINRVSKSPNSLIRTNLSQDCRLVSAYMLCHCLYQSRWTLAS